MDNIVPLFSNKVFEAKGKEKFLEAMSLVSQQRYEEATVVFVRCCELQPQNAEYLFYAGVSFYLSNKLDESSKYLKDAVSLDKDKVEYLYTYGMVIYRGGKFIEALDVFQEVVKRQPTHKDGWYYLGKTYNELKSYKDAKAALLRALSIDSKFSDALFEVGYSEMLSFEFDSSKAYFQKCIDLSPTNSVAYYYMSQVLMKLGEHGKAIEILELLIKQVPAEKPLAEKNIEVIKALQSL